MMLLLFSPAGSTDTLGCTSGFTLCCVSHTSLVSRTVAREQNPGS